MLPADFMSRVVDWPGDDNAPGWVNVHWLSPKGPGMRGRPFKHLHDFMSFVQYAANKPGIFKDIFFCTSTQKDHGKEFRGRYTAHRHHSKALWHKALFLDVDIKPEGYATLKEALQAVHAFRLKAGLPPPSAIVLTGGGIHVYWISLKPLTTEQWRPYAEGLKAEVLSFGLKCDVGVIADAARILRVPGTVNNKQDKPRPVRLAHLGASYDFSDVAFAGLAAKAPVAPVQKVPVTAAATFAIPPEFAAGPAKILAHLDPLAGGFSGIGARDNDLPLDATEIFKGCNHFRDSVKTGGKSQSQSLWHLNALACTWLDNGRTIFHGMARGYRTYTYDESDKMFDRKVKDRAQYPDLGWPLCETLESEGAKCAGCPYYGKLKSPLSLAERVYVPPPPMPPPPPELELPEEYTVNEKGFICEIVEKEDRHGNSRTEYVPLFWSKLRAFNAQGGNRQLQFQTSLDLDKWGTVEINEATDLINETTIVKALRQHGVKPNTSISAKRIITFVTSYMAKLDASKARQNTVPFGWLRETGEMPVGFAYGGRVILQNNTERQAGYSDKQLEKFYTPTGDPEPWWKLLRIITARHHPALECIVASSFAAPLSYATGLYNGIICSWSPGGGAHKSTSMQVGAAVWGCPKLTKEHPGASHKGIIHKMGMIKNLPVYWDEINSPELMKGVASILGNSTQGSGGSKLTSGRDFHVYDEWQTLMQVGANLSLVEHIINNRTGTDAQLQRVFEFQVEKRIDTQKHYNTDRLSNALDHNYGHVGVRYSQLLGTNVERIHKQMTGVLERFSNEVSIRSEERFRCAVAATVYMGAVLANEIGCDFNVNEMWSFLKDEFLKQRHKIDTANVVAGTGENSANWTSHFLKTNADNAVWIDTMPSRRPGQPPGIVWVAGVNHLRPRPIHVRLSISDRVIDISRTKFFEWLVLKEVIPSSVLTGLVRHFGATEPGRLNLAAGAGVLGGGREPVIRIPVPDDSPFLSDLYAHTPPDQRPMTTPTTSLSGATATVISIDKARP